MVADPQRASPKPGLIVVSNRLPVRITVSKHEVGLDRSSGGLAAALAGVEGIRSWVGWAGAQIADANKERVHEAMADQGLCPVFLSNEEEQHYYAGMCNSVLWPLLHYFPSKVDLGEKSWANYVKVNHKFADAVAEVAEHNDQVWIHDFHLMLLPAMLRSRRPDLHIGFFLHVPFPSSELWRLLPQREALLRGLLGADHIGFHTADYLRHFRSSCLRVLGIEPEADHITQGARRIGLGAHPIGTDVERFQKALNSPAAFGKSAEFIERWKDRKIVLGVERLDYTKGVLAKLKAFERFLERDPKRASEVAMLQLLVPSREEHEGYRALLREIEKEISRINGRFGKPGLTPLEYMHTNLDDSELVALYRHANVMMVTPVRDGMNLVAQEFVLCQGHAPHTPDHARGMLILSEFAGAAMVLPHAMLVNPWDIDALSDAIEGALRMSQAERQLRIADMTERVVELNSRAWAREFLDKLSRAALHNSRTQPAPIDAQAMSDLRARFRSAKRRRFFLDYDGTLCEIAARPELASPTPEILGLLKQLTELPNTEVHLVSGRHQATMANWFGQLPVLIGAEHGYYRLDKSGEWTAQSDVDLSWMPRVRELLTETVEEVPGSFLETKSCAMAWHYRLADPAYGKWRARELVPMLQESLSSENAEPLLGHAVVEVRAKGADKGAYVAANVQDLDADDFILCAGDDRTDLDMYRRLPEGSLVCHVGSLIPSAQFVVDTPAALRELLTNLLADNSLDLSADEPMHHL
ncbi:MAG: bifunctional alpha,alpha-trehalose-phosphate synthase (UDP-forming)/trehalose-phosphatase [Planctomycetota bacterium]|nr:bifunctional alpha,alpha-trehalose-phosphate synthase (UDP-forming)/trehalose-phosphatase [Planctomycetota bacterium]